MEHRWGMAIDLDRCTGCEACVVACHAENNLPLSDPDQAEKGRAFHWIRVDRYYEGEFPDIRVKYMPVLCQQCRILVMGNCCVTQNKIDPWKLEGRIVQR
jgi:molybdopterin-containing oxidoreductase family iron-sulfur binding subunit